MTEANIKKIAIAGARGQMGALFTEDFRKLGKTVFELGRPYEGEEMERAVSQCDMLLLSIPVNAMQETLKLLMPHVRRETILVDVGSVKELPIRDMLAVHDGPVVGTHPLFGPVIPEGFEPKVAIMPGRDADADAAKAVYDLFERCGYTCFDATAEQHDRAMALVQGLNFVTTTAYLSASRDIEGIENFVTPSFNRRLDAARKMLTMDAELFEIISEANPYMQETARKFMGYLSLAAGGELDLLADRAQWWWRNESS